MIGPWGSRLDLCFSALGSRSGKHDPEMTNHELLYQPAQHNPFAQAFQDLLYLDSRPVAQGVFGLLPIGLYALRPVFVP